MRPQIERSATETTTDGVPAGRHAVTSAATTRRQFLEAAAAGIAAATVSQGAWGGQPKHDIPYRTLGRTGEKVSVVGIGGYHLGRPGVTEDESLRIVRKALDEGINFLDNCWDYNGGESEIRMGRALRNGYRKKAFLMTKIDGRDKNTAEKQINQSIIEAAANRSDRSPAVSRSHSRHRPRPYIRSWRRAGSRAPSTKGWEGSLHRIHRPQEPGFPLEDAKHSVGSSIHL
jgi:hypothetical protein